MVFLATNPHGDLHLASIIDKSLYVAAPISLDTALDVIECEADISTALQRTNNRSFVILRNDKGVFEAVDVLDDIPEDMLPEPGAYISAEKRRIRLQRMDVFSDLEGSSISVNDSGGRIVGDPTTSARARQGRRRRAISGPAGAVPKATLVYSRPGEDTGAFIPEPWELVSPSRHVRKPRRERAGSHNEPMGRRDQLKKEVVWPSG